MTTTRAKAAAAHNPGTDDASIPAISGADSAPHATDAFAPMLVGSSADNAAKLRPPAVFHGDSSVNLRKFITQMRIVFRRCPRDFPDEESKVAHAISFCEGVAFNWLQPFMEEITPPSWLSNFDQFADKLRGAFGEEDYLDNVGTDLLNLRQTGSVVAYIAEFRRLSSLLPTWHEDTLTLMFYIGLKEEIKIEVFKAKRPTKMDELTRLAMFFERRLHIAGHRAPARAPNSVPKRVHAPARNVSFADSSTVQQERPFCSFHRSYTHDTADCRALQKQAATGDASSLARTPISPDANSQARQHVRAGATTEVVQPADIEGDDRVVIPVVIAFEDVEIPTTALLDPGSSASLISHTFTKQHAIPLRVKPKPLAMQGVDGHPIAAGPITHDTDHVEMRVGEHREMISFEVTTLGDYPIILGMPWFKKHSPTVRWNHRRVIFDSDFCFSCHKKQPQDQVLPISATAYAHVDGLHIVRTNGSAYKPEGYDQARPRDSSRSVHAAATTVHPMSADRHSERPCRGVVPISILPGEHAQPQHVVHSAAAAHHRGAHTLGPDQHQLLPHGFSTATVGTPLFGHNPYHHPPFVYAQTNLVGQATQGAFWLAPQPFVVGYFPMYVPRMDGATMPCHHHGYHSVCSPIATL